MRWLPDRRLTGPSTSHPNFHKARPWKPSFPSAGRRIKATLRRPVPLLGPGSAPARLGPTQQIYSLGVPASGAAGAGRGQALFDGLYLPSRPLTAYGRHARAVGTRPGAPTRKGVRCDSSIQFISRQSLARPHGMRIGAGKGIAAPTAACCGWGGTIVRVMPVKSGPDERSRVCREMGRTPGINPAIRPPANLPPTGPERDGWC